MSQLRQRVFMIQVRPTFVKPGPAPGFPNVATRYLGKMYRSPLAGEQTPTLNPNLPGYAATIELPPLNHPVLTTGATANTGGGIERFRDNVGRGRMPADRPAPNVIADQEAIVQMAREDLDTAEAALALDPSNPVLILAADNARQTWEDARHALHVMTSGARVLSVPPFNENGWYSNDYWCLHSTWSSFDECKNYIRMLIDILGFESIMVSNYVELDLELLPNR